MALKADVVAGIRSRRDSCHGLLIMFSSISISSCRKNEVVNQANWHFIIP